MRDSSQTSELDAVTIAARDSSCQNDRRSAPGQLEQLLFRQWPQPALQANGNLAHVLRFYLIVYGFVPTRARREALVPLGLRSEHRPLELAKVRHQ